MDKKSRIFIVGHKGLVGQALLRRLKMGGFSNLLLKGQSELDLCNQKAVSYFFKKAKPEYCFFSSVFEGGIGANIKYPVDLIYKNLIVQTNVIHCAWKVKIKRLLFFASSCVYPKRCPQPMKEEYLLSGPLELTNESYAVAKIAGIKMCQTYNRQYKTNFISVIPATIFGPHDNFDSNSSHVIPALIRRFHEAKIKNKSSVSIWGTGRPHREFIYADDLADACIFLMRHCNRVELINIGTGTEISIRRLALLINKITGFKGKLKFDIEKPDGVFRKLLNVRRLTSLGWQPKVDLKIGLQAAYQWYLKGIKNR